MGRGWLAAASLLALAAYLANILVLHSSAVAVAVRVAFSLVVIGMGALAVRGVAAAGAPPGLRRLAALLAAALTASLWTIELRGVVVLFIASSLAGAGSFLLIVAMWLLPGAACRAWRRLAR
jgi:hypothetical protein